MEKSVLFFVCKLDKMLGEKDKSEWVMIGLRSVSTGKVEPQTNSRTEQVAVR